MFIVTMFIVAADNQRNNRSLSNISNTDAIYAEYFDTSIRQNLLTTKTASMLRDIHKSISS